MKIPTKVDFHWYVALIATLLSVSGYGGVAPESSEVQSTIAEDLITQPLSDKETLTSLSWSGRVVSIRAKHSWQCLDVRGVSYEPGSIIQQYPCHGGSNQKFLIDARGDGYYRLIAQHSWECLDVQGVSSSAGALLQQYWCHTGYNQQFLIVDAGNGYYRLIARHSGMCLDVSGVSYNAGAPIHQYWCHGGDNQQFRLE